MIINKELQLANDLIQYTGTSIFLTGKAGTGKTTFLHNLKLKSPKRMVVLAPTGVAAINAGGVTIHSFFQLPFCPHVPTLLYQDDTGTYNTTNEFGDQKNRTYAHKYGRDKIKIFKTVDLIVIDEISMVRADILDAIDEILRKYRRNDKPFGGAQMLFIGDVKQLAPVAKEEEWKLIEKYYDSPYFFSSHAFRRSQYTSIELVEIFRQEDKKFIDLLNKVRSNKLDDESINILNERYIPGFNNLDNKGYITLTSHNYQAKNINNQHLEKIDKQEFAFYAEVKGDFPEYSYPTDEELIIKVGSQVMFVKNDPSNDKRYFNGKIGIVEDIDNNKIYVKCDDNDENITVQPLEWTNVKYVLNHTTNEIEEEIQGTFKQYPLKLAWAITIHKSQGLTFEKLIVDAQMSFAHGQVYVALSRCKSLEGLVLISKIDKHTLKNDYSVDLFEYEIEHKHADIEKLQTLKKKYFYDLLNELFTFEQLY
ncbi:AAA family ATPase, partial [Odoribacter sp. OttesenSCG-928-L07]|nr:AAA family ATPase [Odoribacter sp. OttesenSCG-928-L07]